MNSISYTLSEINDYTMRKPVEYIGLEEQRYHKTIEELAKRIATDKTLKIILLAGPSASGKTTSAHLLGVYLQKSGIKSQVVSLDDFYLDHDKSPLLADGRRDTESVNALDTPELERCLSEIIRFGRCEMPVFDFVNSMRFAGKRNIIDVSNGGIVIVEGLHALNPAVTAHLQRQSILKIYISVNNAVFGDDGERLLSSRQLRLVRRALRDETFRNSDINRTLHLWSGVVDGEQKYLYGYKPMADIRIATLHGYEPCLYRDRFIGMASQVKSGCENYDYFMKTVQALEKFVSLKSSYIPDNSLIREFIGNSGLKSSV